MPIFHLTGQPTRAAKNSRSIVHHTLGNGEFDLFYDMTAPAEEIRYAQFSQAGQHILNRCL